MIISIFGANSQIAKDFVLNIYRRKSAHLLLYVRDVASYSEWLYRNGMEDMDVYHYDAYGDLHHDVVINFVGVGDPLRAAKMGSSILEITRKFDDIVLSEVIKKPNIKYIFLSSGAVYGHGFYTNVSDNSYSKIPINNIRSQDFYSIAKLYAETVHRSYSDLDITDIRVFNYFSRTQDLNARFMITDAARAISGQYTLEVSDENNKRDYLNPSDFYSFIFCIIKSPVQNTSIDCYSRAPIDKFTLLEELKKEFGLRYKTVVRSHTGVSVNATGEKNSYFSVSKKAGFLGYVPDYTSLESVVLELQNVLRRGLHGNG